MESFVLTGYMNDVCLCDKIVQMFKDNRFKQPGTTGSKNPVVNHAVKESSEIAIDMSSDIAKAYFCDIQTSLVDKYIAKYKYVNEYAPWGCKEGANVQFYPPGGGFKAYHSERVDLTTSHRHMVFMTYLNDVTDAGETEFLYQNIKVQPRKGLSVMWPADWTHTHRGIPSPTQEKYIITGWFSYLE